MNTWISYKNKKSRQLLTPGKTKLSKKKKKVRSLPLGLSPNNEYSVKII